MASHASAACIRRCRYFRANRMMQTLATDIRNVVCCCIAFGAALSVQAQQATVFSFLRYNQTARVAAMGGAGTALLDEPGSLFQNPAAIRTMQERSITATFMKHVLDINSGVLGYVDHIEGIGTIGIGIIGTSFGTFERSTTTGDRMGTFGASDVALGVSYANSVDSNITYGVTLKFISSTLDDMQSTGVAVDAGVHYRLPDKRSNVGLSIMHLGTQLSTYDGTRDRLPVDVRLGINHRLRGLPLLMNVSLNHLADDANDLAARFLSFSVGGELYLGKYIQLRAGYDNGSRNLSGVNVATQLSGLSFGVGIITSFVTLDYALSSLGTAASIHRASIRIRP
ncbi:MAG: PorV/PorQ family protein [Candidatus Kapabacteria bacterium]|nr:PorV/PorQ family protein [Candidatus Kapabacteria bacterium]